MVRPVRRDDTHMCVFMNEAVLAKVAVGDPSRSVDAAETPARVSETA
jgi:hypothetical protein